MQSSSVTELLALILGLERGNWRVESQPLASRQAKNPQTSNLKPQTSNLNAGAEGWKSQSPRIGRERGQPRILGSTDWEREVTASLWK